MVSPSMPMIGSEKWLEAIIHGMPDFLTLRALSDVLGNYSLWNLMSWVLLAEYKVCSSHTSMSF